MPKYRNQLSHISIISRGIIHAIYRTSCISFSMSYLLLILFQIGSSFLRYGSFKELEHDQEIYPLIDSSPPVEQWS